MTGAMKELAVIELPCAEMCAFCFESFWSAQSFIDHAENCHREEKDPIKLIYMNAIRARLHSQAATLLEKARFDVHNLTAELLDFSEFEELGSFNVPNVTAEPPEFEELNTFDALHFSFPVSNVNALDLTQLATVASPFTLGVPSTVMTIDDQISDQAQGSLLSRTIAPIEIPVQDYQMIQAEPLLAWDSAGTYDLSSSVVPNNTFTPIPALENSLVLSTSSSDTCWTDVYQLRKTSEHHTSSNMLVDSGDIRRTELQPFSELDPSTAVYVTPHRPGFDFSDWSSNGSEVGKLLGERELEKR
ncbi:hypothetical protein CSOJ01_14929 [Colletotrichum sojae]|uniref:C2H2-type domain-containing protein n=1 Tax=Colletotrichum sojae TaxID=2175907 RepID=A0A8H6MIF3_9PEZI|nr:hypothetical protein CSOJ01_14929 [Colletotrichum sojae]